MNFAYDASPYNPPTQSNSDSNTGFTTLSATTAFKESLGLFTSASTSASVIVSAAVLLAR